MVKETIVSRRVVAWWKYNPILQKPTSLEPVTPWSWFWYYGPDPASGTSYGQYHDSDYDFDMISAKTAVVYSPATGKPLEFIDDLPFDEIKDQFSKATSGMGDKISCNACKAELVSDYPLGGCEDLYCCACGHEIEQTGTTKLTMGKKTMRVKAEKAATIKRKIRANILKKRKEEEKAIKAEEEKAEDDDELISLDTIMEAMQEEAGMQEDLEKQAEAADADEGVEDEIMAEGDEVEFVEEQEAPAEEKEEEDDDEYYDLDMVLSMINKKQKMSQKTNVKAEEVKEDKKEEVVEVAGEEPKVEPKAEEPAVEEKKPTEVVEKEPNMVSEENPKAEELPPVDMEAMKFEPLASLKALANVKKEEIDMTLYNEESENPVWNVTVAGVPTARIQLKDQMHPEEIRAVFCSDDYAKDLMIHCEKTGFVQTMNKVKAEFWSNYTSNKEIADRFQKEALASFDIERKKLLASFKQDFLHCIHIVSAGMAKNFYPDMGNPLKEHLFTNLRTVGLPEGTAISVVEKSFAEGSAPYFDALFDKAEEYMHLTPDARKEIAAAISHGSVIEQKVSSELESASPATLAERLAQASVVANVTSGGSLKVNRDLLMDTNEYKQQLKSVWRR